TLRAWRGRGDMPVAAVKAVAAWLLHLRGLGAPVKDVQANVVLELGTGGLPEAAAKVVGFVAPDLADDRELIDAVLAAAEDLEALFAG
ncbi:MAG TPA: mannitol dehydrogenase family protein, partial [Propionibacterium sp.]|nr:mannitol dehydrogenase family protein [Propionibacterium sp.]